MGSVTKNELDYDEAIQNLLMVLLLKDGVDLKIIEKATGIASKTIKNRFPMKDITGEKK